MPKFRKVQRAIGILMCMVFVAGCSTSNKVGMDENLTEPVYEIESLPEDIKSTGEDVVFWEKNGYKHIGLERLLGGGETFYTYFPYIEEDKKLKGVLYLEDIYDWDEMDKYNYLNMPEGTAYAEKTSLSTLMSFTSTPMLEGQKVKYNPLTDAGEFFSVGTDDKGDLDISTYDVRSVSFALYEDFYKEIPNMTVKLYGVTKKIWCDYFGTDNSFYISNYPIFVKMCKESNYSNCKLITEKKVDKSGVYYFDFNEMCKSEDYVQFFLVLEMDKSLFYSYTVEGGGIYNIDDEEKYAAWKKEHIDQFIGAN